MHFCLSLFFSESNWVSKVRVASTIFTPRLLLSVDLGYVPGQLSLLGYEAIVVPSD